MTGVEPIAHPTHKEEKCPEQEEEQYGSSEVRVIHDVLIDAHERIKDSKRLKSSITMVLAWHLAHWEV